MTIRKMEEKDKEHVLEMMIGFYASDAVSHKAPVRILQKDIEDCIGECLFAEGYVFEEDDCICGYGMIAKSYSTEYGGMCIWFEDIFVKEEFRGRNMGGEFISYIEREFDGKAVRYRLEVEHENVHAYHVYQKNRFEESPYLVMDKNLGGW